MVYDVTNSTIVDIENGAWILPALNRCKCSGLFQWAVQALTSFNASRQAHTEETVLYDIRIRD
jgi:hypothetical protein